MVGWTVGVWDSDQPGKEVLWNRLVSRLQNGSIILLHDGGEAREGVDRSQTVAVLPEFIEYCLKLGYRFVSVPTMLHLP